MSIMQNITQCNTAEFASCGENNIPADFVPPANKTAHKRLCAKIMKGASRLKLLTRQI